MDSFQKMMNDVQDKIVDQLSEIAKEHGINILNANHIWYFRTRARWTQEKEDYLLKLAKAGKKLPNVVEDFTIEE